MNSDNVEEIQKDILKDLDIRCDDLSEEFSKQAGKFAHWAFLSERKKAQKDYAKLRLEVFSAELGKELRIRDSVKQTDKSIENEIKSNSEWKKLNKEHILLKYEESILSVAVEAFNQRCQMLISLGAHARSELEGDIKILKESVKKKMTSIL